MPLWVLTFYGSSQYIAIIPIDYSTGYPNYCFFCFIKTQLVIKHIPPRNLGFLIYFKKNYIYFWICLLAKRLRLRRLRRLKEVASRIQIAHSDKQRWPQQRQKTLKSSMYVYFVLYFFWISLVPITQFPNSFGLRMF